HLRSIISHAPDTLIPPILCTALHTTMLFFFFFHDPATTEIYTLSLHDALPISSRSARTATSMTSAVLRSSFRPRAPRLARTQDRSEEQRLNSSHVAISYAVFCLKKKKKKYIKGMQ